MILFIFMPGIYENKSCDTKLLQTRQGSEILIVKEKNWKRTRFMWYFPFQLEPKRLAQILRTELIFKARNFIRGGKAVSWFYDEQESAIEFYFTCRAVPIYNGPRYYQVQVGHFDHFLVLLPRNEGIVQKHKLYNPKITRIFFRSKRKWALLLHRLRTFYYDTRRNSSLETLAVCLFFFYFTFYHHSRLAIGDWPWDGNFAKVLSSIWYFSSFSHWFLIWQQYTRG